MRDKNRQGKVLRIGASLLALVTAFALAYLVWAMICLLAFGRVLDPGAMVMWPGVAALTIWLLVGVPIAWWVPPHDPWMAPLRAARGGAAASAALVVLVHLMAVLWPGVDPWWWWRLIPGIGAMFVAFALLVGAGWGGAYGVLLRASRGRTSPGGECSTPVEQGR